MSLDYLVFTYDTRRIGVSIDCGEWDESEWKLSQRWLLE